MRTMLFGADSGPLSTEVRKQPLLELMDPESDARPDVVICFGGDGTLLTAEQRWPGVPKAPIRNSRRGHRCIPHPPAMVIERLAKGTLCPHAFLKAECRISTAETPPHGLPSSPLLVAMNEFNVHMGLVNSAVRFRLWLNGRPYQDGEEILGDGFLVSTPFGSTAYYNQITRGLFQEGLGIAIKATNAHTDHVVVPESTEIKAEITRGPAVLAIDNALEYYRLEPGDTLAIRRHPHAAHVLSWDPIWHPWDIF